MVLRCAGGRGQLGKEGDVTQLAFFKEFILSDVTQLAFFKEFILSDVTQLAFFKEFILSLAVLGLQLWRAGALL